MLSRVANTLYWMVRYVERADNMARLIDVNEQLLLDFEKIDSMRLGGFWMPIVLATGDDELFGELYDNAGSAEVIRFLAGDRRNPNSIVSCVALARENARMVRDQLSDELWEELNALYLFITSDEGARLLRDDPPKFHATVRRSVLTFHGIAASTISRTQIWDFMDLGRYLERADKTTRFLDISNFLPPGADGTAGSPEVLHWNAILRSCGAMGAFRAEDGGEPGPLAVSRLLLFSATFPRSVRFCIRRVDECLHGISGTQQGTYADAAERECGRLKAELDFGSAEEVYRSGLHDNLDHLQSRFNTIGEAVFRSYVSMPEAMDMARESPPPSGAAAVAAWKLQQEQQQQ